MNLEIAQEENIIMKEVINQEWKDKNMSQQKVDKMENQIHVVSQAISYNIELEGASS